MAETARSSFWDMEDSLGSYLGEIAHSKPLSAAEEVDLARKIKSGDEVARNRLVEANLRFAGPETMETRIFGRLTAWQNWIFNRPNATGPEGALQRYGTGQRGAYDMERV